MKTDRKGPGLTPRAREMSRLFEEQRASGLSIRAFAEKRGLRPGTLHWWRRELRLRKDASAPSGAIVPVRLVEAPETASSRAPTFRVEFAGGRPTIEVPADFDAASLRRLLEVFSTC